MKLGLRLLARALPALMIEVLITVPIADCVRAIYRTLGYAHGPSQ